MRSDNALLLDMLHHARKVRDFVSDLTRAEFLGSERTQMAVLYALLVVGEAAGDISESGRKKLPELDWTRIVGFRNIAAHEYFNVEPQRVWEIVQEDVPFLIERISEHLNGEERPF